MNVDISVDRTWQNNFLNRIDEDGVDKLGFISLSL